MGPPHDLGKPPWKPFSHFEKETVPSHFPISPQKIMLADVGSMFMLQLSSGFAEGVQAVLRWRFSEVSEVMGRGVRIHFGGIFHL